MFCSLRRICTEPPGLNPPPVLSLVEELAGGFMPFVFIAQLAVEMEHSMSQLQLHLLR